MRILSVIGEAVSALFAIVPDVPAHATRKCDEYGEELAWMGAGEMDGFELHNEGNGR